MTKKHTIWTESCGKNSGVENIIYEGDSNEKKELKRLMEELPLAGIVPITVEFSKKGDCLNKKRVYIKPKENILGIGCIFKNGKFDYNSPLHFVTLETDTGYIELTYKNYDLWVLLYGSSKQIDKKG
jgi:hypothetical protein